MQKIKVLFKPAIPLLGYLSKNKKTKQNKSLKNKPKQKTNPEVWITNVVTLPYPLKVWGEPKCPLIEGYN